MTNTINNVTVEPGILEYCEKMKILEFFLYNVMMEYSEENYIESMSQAFCWNKTPEGGIYWSTHYRRYVQHGVNIVEDM